MKKQTLLAVAALCGMSAAAIGQSVSYDYGVKVTNSGGDSVDANATAIDLNNGVWISSAYGQSPTLYFYNLSDGSAASPAFANFSWDSGTSPGTLAGFGVAADAGEIFLWDHADGIQKLDDKTDSEASLLNDATNEPAALSRNLQVEGDGADTYIVSAGAANTPNADAQVYKADDTNRTSITEQGAVSDAGKAGASVSEITSGNPPQWLAGSDTVGGISALRVFNLTGSFPGDADLGFTQVNGDTGTDCVMAQFDTTNLGAPYVFNLEAPADSGTNGVDLVMYEVDAGADSITEVARASAPLADVTDPLGIRGSLHIDRGNQELYGAYRGANSDEVVLVKFSYSSATDVEEWELYH